MQQTQYFTLKSYIKSVCIGIIALSSLLAPSASLRFFNHSDATGFDIKSRESGDKS
ncbi:hypothetical protein COO91_04469 [Nostoc flagelliforme CCNUN1]|uniref:Uncharacterized protein n=1 Tax=Nostoc flagelliforme CCNUN1 TaxID=2038116 RepID=A0A2K8SSR7_9NOSO|nr:hypothetical protein COO91_04469 [Nostoc flagelliforme CCNUN1]